MGDSSGSSPTVRKVRFSGSPCRWTAPRNETFRLMQPSSNATVFIVDDDASVREALAWLLRSRHLLSEGYAGGAEFEAMLQAGYSPVQPCCLLLDVRMPGMSGLALFDKLAERGLVQVRRVTFLTSHTGVPTTADIL